MWKLMARGMLVAGAAVLAVSLVLPPGSAVWPVTSGNGIVNAAPAAPTQPVRVRRGGVLRDVQRLAIDSLDPHLGSTRDIMPMHMLFDTLFSYRPVDEQGTKWELGPELAESFRVVNPTTIELRLRRGVKFHDGSDFNAAVLKWNIERAATHPRSRVKEVVKDIREVQTVDDYMVRLMTASPRASLPAELSAGSILMFAIVSRQAVERLGDERFGANPVGSGPMQFKEWVRDDRIVLERFANHWERGADGQPLPYLDGVVSRLIPDQSVSFIELRSGNIDTFLELDPKDLALARGARDLAVQGVPGMWRAFPGFYFNPRPGTQYPFSNNRRLREAAEYAIDRESMAKALGFGIGGPNYSFYWFPGMLGYDDKLPRRAFNLDKARALLTEAGFPNGVDVEVKVINRTLEVRSVEALQGMWAQAGIRLKIRAMDRLPWIADGRSGNYEALSHVSSSRVDPQVSEDSRTGSTYNWPGYSNSHVDRLWEQAAAESDAGKRAEIYKRIQRSLYIDAFHVTGFRFPQMAAVNRRVNGLTTVYNYRYVWMDR